MPSANIPDRTLGRLGTLEVRLARTPEEFAGAQRLRFQVFRESRSSLACCREASDRDEFDPHCDHLIVMDTTPGATETVATCRLLPRDVAEAGSGFYSSREFDLGPLIAAHPGARLLEVGRSCVAERHRARRAAELMWHGLWRYTLERRADILFGCASFDGTDLRTFAQPLAFLARHASAPLAWRARAWPDRYIAMDAPETGALDIRGAMRALPPLVRGYIKLGARVGDGAVIDHEFGTTDVLVMLRVKDIDPRYIAYYRADASRRAA